MLYVARPAYPRNVVEIFDKNDGLPIVRTVAKRYFDIDKDVSLDLRGQEYTNAFSFRVTMLVIRERRLMPYHCRFVWYTRLWLTRD